MDAKEARDLAEEHGAESTTLDREHKRVTAYFDTSNEIRFNGGIIINCQNYAGGLHYQVSMMNPQDFKSWREFYDCIDKMNAFIKALDAEGFREKRTP